MNSAKSGPSFRPYSPLNHLRFETEQNVRTLKDSYIAPMIGRCSRQIWCSHGRPRDFLKGWANYGVWGTEVPSGVQWRSSSGSLGAKPPKADDKLSSTETFDNIFSYQCTKIVCNISTWEKGPLIHAGGRLWVVWVHSIALRTHYWEATNRHTKTGLENFVSNYQ